MELNKNLLNHSKKQWRNSMERKIKFRGKDVETGEWLYGDLIQRIGKYPSIMYDYEHNGKIRYAECCVKKETIGQFTGLFDKNEKEIYEGDILRSDNYPFSIIEDGVKDNYFGEVYWEDSSFTWEVITWKNPDSKVRGISHGIGCCICDIEPNEYEVIGNIFDDPEILKMEE